MDTGSTDGQKKSQPARAGEVHDFPWTDDFAAARNAVCRRQVSDMDGWTPDDVMEPEQAARLKI